MATPYKGKVKWFNPGKGFGFVIPDAPLPGQKEAKDVFVHYSNIEMNGFKTLNEGQEVTFEVGDGKGGSQAVKVVPTATAAGN
jgi:CspA family cold shock protein